MLSSLLALSGNINVAGNEVEKEVVVLEAFENEALEVGEPQRFEQEHLSLEAEENPKQPVQRVLLRVHRSRVRPVSRIEHLQNLYWG